MEREQELVKLKSSESLLVLDGIITRTNLLSKTIPLNNDTKLQEDLPLPLSAEADREEIIRFKISTLSKIINFCSLLNERSAKHPEELHQTKEELHQIKKEIINLITRDPDICRVEIIARQYYQAS